MTPFDLYSNKYKSNQIEINSITLNLIKYQTIGTKVTKRAVETKLPVGTFGFSEYSQIFESTSSSVPKVRENIQF